MSGLLQPEIARRSGRLNNKIGIWCGSSSESCITPRLYQEALGKPFGPDFIGALRVKRDSTTQVEAGNSSSANGPFKAVGGGVRVRFGQASRHATASDSGYFASSTRSTSSIHSQARKLSCREFSYFQAAQKGMR